MNRNKANNTQENTQKIHRNQIVCMDGDRQNLS